MAIESAGIVLYRGNPREVFLIHMGGPFWAKKDEGAWSIPKA
jgi:predicted NUDIX family NTP pyrophosphohydrolase